jgi:peptide/nickel transport system substrate-binding protein
LYGPAGDATCNFVTAPAPLVSPNTPNFAVCAFDLSRANKLLDESGWQCGPDGVRQKDGVRMRIRFQTTVNSVRQKTQEIIKQDWEQLGIHVELKVIDASVFFLSR